MKQIWPLLSLVLIAAPLAAPGVAAAEAPTLRGGLGEAVMVLAANKDRDDRRNSGGNRQRGNDDRRNEDRQNNDRQSRDRQPDAQRFDRGNGGQLQNRDDRINRAMSVAGRRGRVLDAGPQGGSVFWVRVATDHGRVDLLVDADTGRIIGER
ncbi:hypothetical protein [Asticcacaulis sp.]|uniref:hypothetical protein n=1 Tax=Asticcacaulis sp. TaxID=1872648 RepID=UPI002BF75C55|nr:hypothetical protein [Asticcacaulis sp.]HTM79680.1 hypothetical protein [Asticcacaulis sp.]